MVTLTEFLNDDLFKLPLSYSGNYTQYLKKILIDGYYAKIEKLSDNDIDNDSFKFSLAFIKDNQKKFTNGLIKSVSNYLDGKPNEAYKELDKTIRGNGKRFDDILNYQEVEPNTDFYRMRIASPNNPLDKNEMFHIPFEKRGLVKTQRFSIPGFPSLYLGSSVYVCWEELGRPLRNQFQVVRINNSNPLKILDLSPISKIDMLNKSKMYRYFMTWPLIAACSIKVQNREDTFKPEYIIPQILLQWISNNREVDAVTYQTTNIDFKNVSTRGNLTNTVFPVLTNRNSGLCPELKRNFKITEPLSPELIDLVEGFGAVKWVSLDTHPLDIKVANLEIVKGKITKYSKSVFGELEEYLNETELKSI